MSQRLPVPGGDDGDWGDILNAYLEVSLSSTGTLNPGVVGTSQIQNNAVTNAQLDGATQTTLASVAGKATDSAVVHKSGDTMTGKLVVPSFQVTGGSPGSGQVLTADSIGNATWAAAASASNATTGAPGLVQLSGDLGGTATSPSVSTVLGGKPPVAYLEADATGVTDIGSALQAAFDASPVINLSPGGTYYLNTPIFLDSASTTTKYILNMNGATLKFGPGLPSASTMSGLAGTTWAFFVNTLRSALSGSVVTTSVANSSTGTTLCPSPRFVIRNGTFNANGNIIGIAYGNNAATRIETSSFQNIQCGISWNGYVDENIVVNCQTIGSSPTGGSNTRFIKQTASGDGTSAINCKGYGAVILDLSGCYGFQATSCVSGEFILVACKGLIDASHQETDEINTTPYSISLDRTNLTLLANRTNATKSTTKYTIQINDTAGNNLATHLDLVDHSEVFYFRTSPADATDTPRGPTIYINALNNNGRVRSWGSKTTVQNSWSGNGAQYPEGLYITSAVAGITTALAAGADQVATGNFELIYNGNWLVINPAGLPVASKNLVAPTLTVATDTTTLPGSLTNGTAYQYVAAGKSASGQYTVLSAAVSASAGSDGSMQLTLTNPSTPCTIALWRVTGSSGVTTTPDHYIEIPLDGYTTIWFDTGANINGRPWQTTSIPVPNTVAATATITNATDPAGALAVTFDRGLLTAIGTTSFTSGEAVMCLVKHKGGTISAINWRPNSTASGVNNAWGAITSLEGIVLAVTANQTSIANSNLSWALTATTDLPPGTYYLTLMVNASGMPTVITSNGANTTISSIPPIVVGSSPAGPPTTGTLFTTPPTVGSTIAVPIGGGSSTVLGTLPYMWLT